MSGSVVLSRKCVNYDVACFVDCQSLRVTALLENLEKSWNSKVVGEYCLWKGKEWEKSQGDWNLLCR